MTDEFNGKDRSLLQDIDRRLATTQATVATLERTIDRRLDSMVSKDAFMPVARIAYGLAGAVLTGVMVAILALVLK